MKIRSIEKESKTVGEAIAEGLAELSAARDAVDVAVLDEGSKGLFGLFGGKPARVRLTLKDTPELRAEDFLLNVAQRMGVEATISLEERDEALHIELAGASMGTIIGHRGETLDALQYLTSIVVNRGREHYTRIVLDTENYRLKREESLRKLADKLATKAYRTRRRVVLEPMSPYERRILHSALQDHPYVTTHSEGEDSQRHVVILPK